MILDEFRLDGQVALVTGGTKGIGKAITLAFAEAGADVAVVSRAPDESVQAAVESIGRRFVGFQADLTERSQTKEVVPAVLKEMGDLDILVNNAGIIRRAPAIHYSEEDWDTTLEIDLNSAFLLSQAAGRIMVEKGRGKIINVASILSLQGGINVAAYSAAKHGVVGLTKALANDWASKGINVNAIAPGFLKTPLTETLQKDPARSKSILSRIPAGRWGLPEDVAGAAVFLASAASDYIHGVVLPVDGGWMSW